MNEQARKRVQNFLEVVAKEDDSNNLRVLASVLVEEVSDDLGLQEYEDRAMALAIYPRRGANLTYTALGLAGECGEFADKVKKMLRDDNETLTAERKAQLVDELGDVLWYVVACAWELHTNLEEVAKRNLYKLEGRHQRGTLSGSGDDR